MDFRVLGPIEVASGGKTIRLRSRKQLMLLGALLARPDQVVPGDLLVEALWGEDPPASAANALQVHVSHLRQELTSADAAGNRLVTRSPGYLLQVDEEELDSLRFERLAAEGRNALRGGKAELASRKLREALSLWRGSAFADLAYEAFIQGPIAALVEARLSALQDRIEADLALGLHLELIGELEALIRAEPLRETFRTHLMLALYRSGRQAEALALGRETSRLLAEELGIDPGPELTRLESAILNQDPALEAPERAEGAQGNVIQAERRVVSVLFTDLSDLIPHDDETDPEDLWTSLLPFHELAAREIEPFGGVIHRVIGDATTAVFGESVEFGDDAERAVRSGLRLVQALEALGQRSEVRTGALRVAIATGTAVVDRLAEGGRGLVVGAVVNTAFRIQRDAPRGRVVVDERTFDRTKTTIRYESVDPDAVPNRRSPRPLWIAVETAAETADRRPARSTFVGRDGELNLFGSIWQRIHDQRVAHLATVVGPPGIGKSRLVREATAAIERLGGRVIVGRSLPYGEGTGYGAFGMQIRSVAEIRETDAPEVARGKLGARVALLISEDERGAVAEHLELVLGLASDAIVADRQVLFQAARRLVEGLAAEQPTVFVFEDIHWADPTLLDLIQALAVRVRDAPAMFVALARPEFLDRHPEWGGGNVPSTMLNLEPLRIEDATLLATTLVQGEDPALAATMAARAEGNPLFIEELAAASAERQDASPERLPETVRATIGARIDALPQPARSLLMDAAVVGRIFWRGALRDPTGATADEALEMLEDRGLIRREPTSRIDGDAQFIFKHALIREVAYAALPRTARRERHVATARFIERTSGDRINESASLLGHHWREGGDAARAVRYLVVAAENARRGWAKSEAVELYDQALELVPVDDRTQQRDLGLQRAFALMEAGDYRRAADALDPLLPELGERDELEAVLARTKAAWWLIDADAVRSFGTRAAELAEELGDPSLSAPALGYIGQISGMEGRPGELIEIGEKALASWPIDALPAELAYEMELVAIAQTWVGRFDDAEANLRDAYAIAERCHSVEAMLRSGASLGLALVGTGKHEDALSWFDDTIRQGRELELLPRFTGRALNMSSSAFRDLFDLDEARRRNEEAIELGHQADFSLAWIQAGIDILYADLLEGAYGSAERAWHGLWEETATTMGFHQWLMAGRLLVARAELDVELSDPVTAIGSATEAIDHALATERPKQEVAARVVLGRALVAAGGREEGLASLRDAVTVAERIGHPTTTWRALVASARVHEDLGDDEGAATSFERAGDVVERFAADLSNEHRSTLFSAPDVEAARRGSG